MCLVQPEETAEAESEVGEAGVTEGAKFAQYDRAGDGHEAMQGNGRGDA